VASGVPDPEVPCVTVADLGILRSVTRDEDGRIVVRLTPTYSGCPAVIAIEMAVNRAAARPALMCENRARDLARLDHRLDHARRPRETARLWHRPAGGIVRRQARLLRRETCRLPALRLFRTPPRSPSSAPLPARRITAATTAPNPSTISSASEDATDGRTPLS
jgi:hypothetical protein